MRLTPTFLLVSLVSFLLPSVAATAAHRSDSRASRTIAARQHRFKRSLLDICANVDLSTVLLGLDLKLCLCLSTLPLALETNLALKLLGLDILTDLITKGGQHCSYPPHARSICTARDPCDFECTDGYVKVGKACVCPLPRVECRGKCALTCPSAIPAAPGKRQSTQEPQEKMARKRRDEYFPQEGAPSTSTRDLSAVAGLDALSLALSSLTSIRQDERDLSSLDSGLSSTSARDLSAVEDLDTLGLSLSSLTSIRKDERDLSPLSSKPAPATTAVDIKAATSDLIKYTNRLYQDLPTLSATPEDDETTVYIKSIVALSAQSLISTVVVSINNSTTTSDLLSHLFLVLTADDILSTSLRALGAHGSLWQDTKDILQVTLRLLYLCDPHADPHPHSHPRPSPSNPDWPHSTPSLPRPTSGSANPPIFIDLTPLLHDLSLGGELSTYLDLDGLLGTKGLNGLTNDLLASLGLGGNAPTSTPGGSGSPKPPPSSGNTILGLDLVALVSSLLYLNSTSSSYSDLLSGLDSATNLSGLVDAVYHINNALLPDTWRLTDDTLAATASALQATDALLHDLNACGCEGDRSIASSLLGLKSSLLGNSPYLLEI